MKDDAGKAAPLEGLFWNDELQCCSLVPSESLSGRVVALFGVKTLSDVDPK